MRNRQGQVPQHPIYSPVDFYIDTPRIGQTEETLTRWLWTGQTGGLILGDARTGKTRAAEILVRNLRSRTGAPVPGHHVIISRRDRKTIHSVFRRVAFSLSLEIKDRYTSDKICDDIVYFLSDEACTNDTRQVVLVVDEVQRLTVDQLSAFAELYDLLREMHVNLLVVFIGNAQESANLLTAVTEERNSHIYGRFFTNKFHYYGLKSGEEVSFCMNQYDSIRYPPQDGPTITQFFLDFEFNRGFRFASLAATVWSIYKQYFGGPLKLESWGMQYFICAMNSLLMDHLPKNDIDDPDTIEAMIHQCIAQSGLVPDLARVK